MRFPDQLPDRLLSVMDAAYVMTMFGMIAFWSPSLPLLIAGAFVPTLTAVVTPSWFGVMPPSATDYIFMLAGVLAGAGLAFLHPRMSSIEASTKRFPSPSARSPSA